MKSAKIIFLLQGALFLSGNALSAPAPKSEDLYWGKEICVIYDYRPMIQRKEKAPHLFAIEHKNQNGGSLVKTYDKKSGLSTKLLFSKVLRDTQHYLGSGTCDRIEVFHPSLKQMDSDH